MNLAVLIGERFHLDRQLGNFVFSPLTNTSFHFEQEYCFGKGEPFNGTILR